LRIATHNSIMSAEGINLVPFRRIPDDVLDLGRAVLRVHRFRDHGTRTALDGKERPSPSFASNPRRADDSPMAKAEQCESLARMTFMHPIDWL
jgi:hypothetical protein